MYVMCCLGISAAGDCLRGSLDTQKFIKAAILVTTERREACAVNTCNSTLPQVQSYDLSKPNFMLIAAVKVQCHCVS